MAKKKRIKNHKLPLVMTRAHENVPRYKVEYNCPRCGHIDVRFAKSYKSYTFCHVCSEKLGIDKSFKPWQAQVLYEMHEYEQLFNLSQSG